MTDRPPSGCRYCGHPERGHGNRWHESVHWHVWHPPTDAQTKQRMLARRADRITARAARYEVQPPSLRDQIAEALYRHTMDHAAGGPARLLTRDETVLWENSLARADAVLPVVEAETADRPDWRPAYDRLAHALTEALTRAETAERQHAEALDQIATERRGRLEAEAAVRRALAVLDQRIGLILGDVGPELRQALTIKQPKETR